MELWKIPALLIAAIGASPPFLALGYHIWETIKPRLVPQAEIDRLAAGYIADFGEGAMDEMVALANRAQLRGETAELGCLIRISRAIARMEASRQGTPQ